MPSDAITYADHGHLVVYATEDQATRAVRAHGGHVRHDQETDTWIAALPVTDVVANKAEAATWQPTELVEDPAGLLPPVLAPVIDLDQ